MLYCKDFRPFNTLSAISFWLQKACLEVGLDASASVNAGSAINFRLCKNLRYN